MTLLSEAEAAGDRVAHEFGDQAARAFLGHTHVETTKRHYLSQNDDVARMVARKVG